MCRHTHACIFVKLRVLIKFTCNFILVCNTFIILIYDYSDYVLIFLLFFAFSSSKTGARSLYIYINRMQLYPIIFIRISEEYFIKVCSL